MGCDIHYVIEKNNSEGKWVGVHTRDVALSTPIQIYHDRGEKDKEFIETNDYYDVLGQRNYTFFASLAGVRGQGPEPKGIPTDLSDLSQMLISDAGRDGHSHSYDTLKDFLDKYIKTGERDLTRAAAAKLKGEDIYTPYVRYLSAKEIRDDYRVVYWFDN